MTIEAAMEELEGSPQLLRHVARLNKIVEDEQRRREQFINDLDEDTKAEFINGHVVVHSPARLGHLRVARQVTRLIDHYVMRHALGEVYVEKCLVRCHRNDYEPDICFFTAAKCAGWENDKLIFPPPDLVVEVLSPSTERNDRTTKLRDYALHGVTEYWIVDADAETVDQYTLPSAADEYALKAHLSGGTHLNSMVLAGFIVPAAAFFDARENERALRALLGQS